MGEANSLIGLTTPFYALIAKYSALKAKKYWSEHSYA